MGEDVFGVVWLVRHEDYGAVGFGGDGEVKVGSAGAGVVDAAEPEAVAVAFDGEMLVDENGSAMGGERFGDQGAVKADMWFPGTAEGGGAGRGGRISGQGRGAVPAGVEGREPWGRK